MAGALGKGYVDVEADPKVFKASLDGLGGDADGAGLKLGKRLAAGLATALTGKIAVDFLGGAMDEAREAEKVMAQTAAVIKSTGGAANVSAKDIDRLATSISLMAGIDDEVIASAGNLLLAFTNIKNSGADKMFDRATQAAVDMSVAFKTDASASAIQLGKALNDPIRGTGALMKIGVSFTQQQKDQIKVMVQAGDVAGAQGVILDELAKHVGGSAAAQATSADRMKVAYDNLKEQIGTALLPVVNAFFGVIIEKVIPAISDLVAWIQKDLGPAFSAVVAVIRDDVLPVLQTIATWAADNLDVLAALAAGILVALVPAFVAWAVAAGTAAAATLLAAAPVIAIGLAIAGLILAGKFLIDHWDDIKRKVGEVWDAVYAKIDGVINAVGEVIGAVVGVIREAWDVAWRAVGAVIETVWSAISGAVKLYIGVVTAVIETALGVIRVAWDAHWAVVKTVVTAAWSAIKTIVQGGIDVVLGIVKTVTGMIGAVWDTAWSVVKTVVTTAWSAIKAIVQGGVDVVLGIVTTVTGAIKTVWDAAWKAISETVSAAWTGIKAAVQLGIDGAKKILGDAMAGVKVVWDKAWNALPDIVKRIFEEVKDIVGNAVGWIADKVKSIADIPGKIVGGVRDALPFASGGIVPGASGVAVPAVVHGGEMVLNRTQQATLWAQVNGAGGGTTGGRQFHLHLTSQDPPNVIEQFRVLELMS